MKNSEIQFEVQKIVDKKIIEDKIKYLVKWKGYSDLQNTWQPIENLNNALTLVKKFQKGIQKRKNESGQSDNITKKNKKGESSENQNNSQQLSKEDKKNKDDPYYIILGQQRQSSQNKQKSDNQIKKTEQNEIISNTKTQNQNLEQGAQIIECINSQVVLFKVQFKPMNIRIIMDQDSIKKKWKLQQIQKMDKFKLFKTYANKPKN